MAWSRYRWLVGSWGECSLQQSADVCGTGLQNRTVLCVTTAGIQQYVCQPNTLVVLVVQSEVDVCVRTDNNF